MDCYSAMELTYWVFWTEAAADATVGLPSSVVSPLVRSGEETSVLRVLMGLNGEAEEVGEAVLMETIPKSPARAGDCKGLTAGLPAGDEPREERVDKSSPLFGVDNGVTESAAAPLVGGVMKTGLLATRELSGVVG